jgi:heme/copper-type cytochrome/quinol oxidase subunit 2
MLNHGRDKSGPYRGKRVFVKFEATDEEGGREMEFFILMISVPLFLIIVLLLSVFVLANYPRSEQAKDMPAEIRTTSTTEGEDHAIA